MMVALETEATPPRGSLVRCLDISGLMHYNAWEWQKRKEGQERDK